MAQKLIASQDIKRLFGDISNHRVVEIMETGATLAELEEVAAWIAEEDDVMGELERPLTGRAAQIYEIVASDPRMIEENRNRR